MWGLKSKHEIQLCDHVSQKRVKWKETFLKPSCYPRKG